MYKTSMPPADRAEPADKTASAAIAHVMPMRRDFSQIVTW